MRYAKLMDASGNSLGAPELVPATISWTLMDGVATAWAEDGKTQMAQLVHARIVWVSHAGMRLEGMEAIDVGVTRFRAQQWQVHFDAKTPA